MTGCWNSIVLWYATIQYDEGEYGIPVVGCCTWRYCIVVVAPCFGEWKQWRRTHHLSIIWFWHSVAQWQLHLVTLSWTVVSPSSLVCYVFWYYYGVEQGYIRWAHFLWWVETNELIFYVGKQKIPFWLRQWWEINLTMQPRTTVQPYAKRRKKHQTDGKYFAILWSTQ